MSLGQDDARIKARFMKLDLKEFFSSFFDEQSEHYDNLQQANENHQRQQKQPLKDATNTGTTVKQEKNNNEVDQRNATARREAESTQQQQQQQGNNANGNNHQGSRSLQCLETLAQKAGIHDITADDCKYDIAHTLLNLDRGQQHQQQIIKQEAGGHAKMSDMKSQQQQIADANAQAQAVAQQQQQQMQQVAMQQEQQMVTSQSPHQIQQVTVNASNGQLQATTSMGPPQQHTVSIHQQVAPQGQMIQTQGGQVLTTAQSGSTTITTMSPLQHSQSHPQQLSDWSHGRLQVIQQPLQNPTYLSQLYNAQGQLLMPSNIALHTGINPQQIQVITKPFNGNQLAPHMLTTAQGKQVIQASQAATFPGYTTQNQQTLVMGGQKVMQKVATSTGQTQQQQGQCVQVSQAMIGSQPTAQIISPLQPGGQPMQFAAPWQFNGIPQVWATNGIQQQTLLTQNPIFIRGTQPDGSPGPGIYIQQSPQTATIQTQQNPTIATQGNVQQIAKPRTSNENIQPKQPTSRPLILPSNNNIRPASSAVSTQTIGAQTPSFVYLQASMGGKPGNKIRTKAPQVRTSPALKADAANQTQIKPYNNMPQHQMVVMNTSTGMTATMTHGGAQMTVDKNQQMVNQNNKNQQQMQQQQQQQQQQTQQTILMQQHPLHQQVQQQILLQQQQQQQQQQQHIQPKPMIQTIQGIQQQQIQMAGDRPIMPVASMSQTNSQQVQQTLQQTIQQGTIQQCLPIQSNLAVTQQTMPMQQMQQIQQQINQMAQQGAIIGQIQTSQPTQMQQVANQTQIHQIQQQQNGQQTITMQQAPQQVPLPSSVPMVKTELVNEVTSADSATQPTNASGETKESSYEATSSQGEVRDTNATSVESKPNLVAEQSVQPTPVPSAVPASQAQPTPAPVENGLSAVTVAEEVKERCPPKAMVKPQVLTHVIEDFVIHESSEPFPVTRVLLTDRKASYNPNEKDADEPPCKKRATTPAESKVDGEMAKCETCGVVDLKSTFKKNNRFCSMACSKAGKKNEKKKKWEKEGIEMDVDSCPSGAESSTSSNSTEDDTPKVDPLKWSVQEVSDFIKNLPGCSDYAEDFLIQEIDGQALMLLKEDHLMTAMSMKLGPALKIVAKIDDMRIDKEPPKQN
ncbi:polyhomeotic-proximal chromatin protein-like isoform X3 [Harmonia axyridis]|uniref:polyhomeotic-proximal chromatin protein-like isoform X3 n=1 Tax=Harmonia axyridis TaxID=115357 RepID=UPI001E278DE5|nr:polyhomeotic-proximal chromatin protein-like isoform X3 [Harmonia axyridis]